MLTITSMCVAFLVGGVPVGLLLARARGVDVTAAGSGNIGATNVARTAGRSLGLLTLLLDALKGALPSLVGLALAGPRLGAGVGCAAILGHVFSPFLGFRGGKGVATAAGVFLALAPVPTLGAVLVFGAAVAATRVVSVGSVTASVALPFGCWAWGAPPEVVGLAAGVAALVLARHAANLARLARGEEPTWSAAPGAGAWSPHPGGAGPQGDGRVEPPPRSDRADLDHSSQL